MNRDFLSSRQYGSDDCGCCEGTSPVTPVTIDNRPGLSAIAYRIGTHTLFKQSMLAMLSSAQYSALTNLTTREDEDYSIALLDAWATVADVLSFYQERIANESFLRTATERFSLRQLARLIGYELSPGVAAATFLAFTVDEPIRGPETGSGNNPAAATVFAGYQTPERVTVAAGTRVQSVPGEDESVQTFETSETIEARAQWNALRPRLTQPQTVTHITNTIYLKGTALNLKEGDRILVTIDHGSTTEAFHRTITRVTVDSHSDRTKIELLPITFMAPELSMGPSMVPSTKENEEIKSVEKTFSAAGSRSSIMANDNALTDAPPASTDMTRSVGEEMSSSIGQSEKPQYVDSVCNVYVFREQAGFFGNNAPYYSSLIGADGQLQYPCFEDWQIWQRPAVPGKTRVLLQKLAHDSAVNNEIEEYPGIPAYPGNNTIEYHEDADVYLDRTLQAVIPGGWALFVNAQGDFRIYRIAGVNEKALVGFGISAKGTGLSLKTVKNRTLEDRPEDKPDIFTMRNTTAYLKSELLELAEMPFQPAELNKGDSELILGGKVTGLKKGQPVALQGELKTEPGVSHSEILFIEEITRQSDFTRLKFSQGLTASCLYDTVTVNANVAPATHGETVVEVLGSGDGTRAHQQFTLRQPPLTHISAAASGGSRSTLQVRVNDLLWEEVSDFYRRGPDERIYITRNNEDGTTTVLFGDGKAGARLPTGRENVRAEYRRGLGTAGNVKAGQLSRLMSKPLGLKQASNPLAASGGDDPEPLTNARMNAPIHVLTLGRIVSLQDYEDFARSFAGVAKALATWSWDGTRRAVVVTVAGPDGADINPGDTTHSNLLKAMKDAGDPHVNLQVISWGRAFFKLAGTVWCGREYLPEKVQPALQQALQTSFGFTARKFGQSARLSEVMAVIQAVPGVEAVDIDHFHRSDEKPGVNAHLPAAMPHINVNGDLAPAELLLLDPETLPALTVTTVGKKIVNRYFFHPLTLSSQMIKKRFISNV